MSGFDIGDRHVGDGSPCLLVAEVGLAHDGSYAMAHAYIDAVAGVDAVKFQCHRGDTNDQWRVIPRWSRDASRQEYWKRTDFTDEQWKGLQAHAVDAGLIFLCSPFSVEAVKMLDPLVPAWKVPSGQTENQLLLDVITETGKWVIWSTGMSTLEEIDIAMHSDPTPDVLLQSTSSYPCPAEKIGLENLRLLRDRYDVLGVGLSDHSGTIYPGLAAVALGCDVLEVHVCFSKEQAGFDTAASLDMAQLRQLVEGVRFIEKAKTPVDKDELAKELEPMRRQFMQKQGAA